MYVYHRTDQADAILRDGFRNGEGRYMTDQWHRGVWLSEYPLDEQEGAFGRSVLRLKIPISVIREYEWVEEGKTYREWLVPAEIANRFTAVLLSPAAESRATDRFRGRPRQPRCS